MAAVSFSKNQYRCNCTHPFHSTHRTVSLCGNRSSVCRRFSNAAIPFVDETACRRIQWDSYKNSIVIFRNQIAHGIGTQIRPEKTHYKTIYITVGPNDDGNGDKRSDKIEQERIVQIRHYKWNTRYTLIYVCV